MNIEAVPTGVLPDILSYSSNVVRTTPRAESTRKPSNWNSTGDGPGNGSGM